MDYLLRRPLNSHLEPGGWFELIDSAYPAVSDDGTLKPEHALWKFDDFLHEAADSLGRPLKVAQDHEKRLKEAGFINIHCDRSFKLPTNPWPKDRHLKEVGLWTLANLNPSLEGLCAALYTRGLGWTNEQVIAFVADVRKDLKNPRIHAYWPL